MTATLVLYDDEFRRITQVCDRLVREANARIVYVIDKNGQLLASGGDADRVDSTSLASLVAGEMAATGGLARLIGENDFSVLFHEGVKENLHISLVGGRVILRVKKCAEELVQIIDVLLQRSQMPGATAQFAEITDDDIDNLFPE
jgi:hypothetical protein